MLSKNIKNSNWNNGGAIELSIYWHLEKLRGLCGVSENFVTLLGKIVWMSWLFLYGLPFLICL